MKLRLFQIAFLLGLAVCGCSLSRSATPVANAPFTITEVARFDSPWAMDFLPGSGVRMTNMALVTEKHGRLWLIDVGTGAKQQVPGVPRVDADGQGGLAEVVAHPDFAGNQRIYLGYSEAGPSGASNAAIGYGRLIFTKGAPTRLEGFKVIWRGPSVRSNVHYSQRIAFAPDGSMFISSGERFQFTPAQNPNSDMLANVTAVVLEVVNLVLRLKNPDAIASPGIYISGIVVLILVYSGWLGGRLVYIHGIGVHDTPNR